jgi:hypothetical protein
MWPCPHLLEELQPDGTHWLLSPEYLRDHRGTRPPLCVRLPSGDEWILDGRTIHADRIGDHGWTVTGAPPALTVSPSINVIGRYHGWLRNGVLSDDCEGRVFPPPAGTP